MNFSQDLSLTHLRFIWFEKSHNMLSQQGGAEKEACNQSQPAPPLAGEDKIIKIFAGDA